MNRYKLRFDCPLGMAQLDQLEEAVRVQCAAWGLPATLRGDLTIAAVELATNIMEHSGAHWMTAELAFEDGRIHLRVCDDGEAFDPVEMGTYFDAPITHPDLEKHMGLYMLGRLELERSYRRLGEGVNEMTVGRRVEG